MLTKLTNTDAREITAALVAGAKAGRAGSAQVLTLIVDTDADFADKVQADALEAGRLHPSRVILIVRDPKAKHRSKSIPTDETDTGIDAEILNGEDLPGEMVTLWLSGAAEEHASSVVLPLLLPELPVVLWWPGAPPADVAGHELANLTNRQILESDRAEDELAALKTLAESHQPGQTDMSWTRLTRWRALLVAMLDNSQMPVKSATIKAPKTLAAAALLQAWLKLKLKVDVTWEDGEGPGLQSVTFSTNEGEMSLTRHSDTEGVAALPGRQPATVALARKKTRELIGEELARLDGDPMLDAVLKRIARHGLGDAS